MSRTVSHDPDDPAEVAAIQTPEGEPDGQLLDPAHVEFTDESSEAVEPVDDDPLTGPGPDAVK